MNTVFELGTEGVSRTAVAAPAKTVLVVDDNENDIALLRLMFQRSSILNPLQAVSGVQDAISYLKGLGVYQDREKYPFPTLMLIDLHLTDGSGFEVLRWIAANKPKSPMAVVVLSGSDVNAFKQAYELGAHSFLTKPLRFDDLQNMVSHVRGIRLNPTTYGQVLELE